MDWWIVLLIIFGGLVFLMMSGMPVAFCFMLIGAVGVFIIWGGQRGLDQLGLQIFQSLNSWTLVVIPLFVLMGEIIFQSGLAPNIIDAVDKWLGRFPGRLAFLAVAAGTLFGTFTGVSVASTAMLATMVPDMEKRGYKKPMSIGPILGSGGLAMMIPPSGLAVLVAAIGEISCGKILIAIIGPGLLMAANYAVYIIGRCLLQPELAPPYKVAAVPLSEKLLATARYILPLGIVVFLVVGVMLLGIATPSEAAASGAVGCLIVAGIARRLSWKVLKKAFASTLHITIMILLILAGAQTFSQILAFSGATPGLVELSIGLPVPPIVTIIAMQVVVLILGMFMPTTAMVMLAIPLFIPVIVTLGYDPVWFGVLFIIGLEMAVTSPPYGINLYVMQGLAPPGTTLGDCIRAALPFLYCDLVTTAFVIVFPAIALWLPSIMR